MGGHLKVASVQLPFSLQPFQAAVDLAVSMVRQAARLEVRVLCLPERWLATPLQGLGTAQTPSLEELLKPFVRLCLEHGLILNLGAILEASGGQTFVQSVLLGPDGAMVGKQAKVHLFREERERFKAGEAIQAFKVGGLTLGILVCHDVVFPEAARVLALKGADLLLNPSCIQRDGVKPWHLYLKARALENRVPILGVNTATPPQYPGRSLTVDLWENPETGIVHPRVLAEGGEKPSLIVASLDLASSKRLRRERLNARRPEAYKALLNPQPAETLGSSPH